MPDSQYGSEARESRYGRNSGRTTALNNEKSIALSKEQSVLSKNCWELNEFSGL